MTRIIATALVVTALVAPFTAAQAQEREDRRGPRLICAGGPGNTITLNPDRNVTVVEIGFEAAPKSWNESDGEIPPGTCTWPDRVLNAEEPRILRMHLPMKGQTSLNPRALIFPLQPWTQQSDRDYRMSLRHSFDGFVLILNEFELIRDPRRRGAWRELKRLDLTLGKLYTISTQNLGEAFQLGRIVDGPPRSEGIDLNSDDIEVRR